MALNIKNSEVEKLAAEVAAMARESKTEAIKNALIERHARLRAKLGVNQRRQRVHEFLEQVIWPNVPAEVLGKPIAKSEREAIVGIGSQGF